MSSQSNEIINMNPEKAYLYARYTLKGLFKEGEEIIAQNAQYSYLYAKDIVRGRFELGEEIIAHNAQYSYYYAKKVLKGRFELGEEAIASNSYYSYLYAKNVLQGRFELGEEAISKNSDYSFAYAQDILKGRFKLGEYCMSHDYDAMSNYMHMLYIRKQRCFHDVKCFVDNFKLIRYYIRTQVQSNQRNQYIEILLFEIMKGIAYSQKQEIYQLYFLKVAQRLHEYEDDFLNQNKNIKNDYLKSLKERWVIYEKPRFKVSVKQNLLQHFNSDPFVVSQYMPYYLCLRYEESNNYKKTNIQPRLLHLEKVFYENTFAFPEKDVYDYAIKTDQAFPHFFNNRIPKKNNLQIRLLRLRYFLKISLNSKISLDFLWSRLK